MRRIITLLILALLLIGCCPQCRPTPRSTPEPIPGIEATVYYANHELHIQLTEISK